MTGGQPKISAGRLLSGMSRDGQPTMESGEPRVSALSSESRPLMLLLLRLFRLLPPANAGMCFFSHLLAPLPLEKAEEPFALHQPPVITRLTPE